MVCYLLVVPTGCFFFPFCVFSFPPLSLLFVFGRLLAVSSMLDTWCLQVAVCFLDRVLEGMVVIDGLG